MTWEDLRFLSVRIFPFDLEQALPSPRCFLLLGMEPGLRSHQLSAVCGRSPISISRCCIFSAISRPSFRKGLSISGVPFSSSHARGVGEQFFFLGFLLSTPDAPPVRLSHFPNTFDVLGDFLIKKKGFFRKQPPFPLMESAIVAMCPAVERRLRRRRLSPAGREIFLDRCSWRSPFSFCGIRAPSP